jgi:glycosyltransferase involved in cell wall biosynthesis
MDFPAGEQLVASAPVLAPAQGFQFSLSSQPAPEPALVTEERVEGIRIIRYPPPEQQLTGFDAQLLYGHSIYQFLKKSFPLQPDLVVSSGAFGSTPFLAELCGCPVIHWCDYYYRKEDSYLHFRPEFPASDLDVFQARVYNAHVLLDLEACTAGCSPTEWQRGLLPRVYQPKVECIFDGIDGEFWRRRPVPRQIGAGPMIPAEVRIVTYVARGLEALRGFDIFMKVAKRIAEARRDVVFVVVGEEHFYHGPDLRYIQERSFFEHVLRQDHFDLDRFIFKGRIPSNQLVEILSLSDVHIYLSAPFVLSWSLFNALACGATVVASDTAPVREVIKHEQNGLLAGFFDVEGLAREALSVLDRPEDYRSLADAGANLIHEKYTLEKTLPKMVELYQRVLRASPPSSV